jgi:hypothetical protein
MSDYDYAEMFYYIHTALHDHISPASVDEGSVVTVLADVATKAARKHVDDLVEANKHLQETVRRLSHLDTRTDNS